MPRKASEAPKVARARTAAQLLDVSERTVWRWIASGRLRVVRLGPGATRVLLADIEKLIDEASQEPPKDEGPPQTTGLVEEAADGGDRSAAA
jgi:excisionase family DNA binding protein